MDVLLSNPEMVEKLEQCVMNWQTQITIVIEEQQDKKPQVCDSPTQEGLVVSQLKNLYISFMALGQAQNFTCIAAAEMSDILPRN